MSLSCWCCRRRDVASRVVWRISFIETKIQQTFIPFNILPSCIYGALHTCFPLFKQCSYSSLVTPAAFAWNFSTDWKCVAFNTLFTFRKGEKSIGAISGEFGGCSSTRNGLFTESGLTDSAFGLAHWQDAKSSFFYKSLSLIIISV